MKIVITSFSAVYRRVKHFMTNYLVLFFGIYYKVGKQCFKMLKLTSSLLDFLIYRVTINEQIKMLFK